MRSLTKSGHFSQESGSLGQVFKALQVHTETEHEIEKGETK